MPEFPQAPRPNGGRAGWWRTITPETLRADAQAALLAAVLVLPQGIAFAALAGLPPAWGLYSAVVPTFVAALAGSSHHVLTGPTNALSLALAAALAPLAAAGSPEYLRLALVLTLLMGGVQLAVGLLRLGDLSHFISPAVLLGFTGGAAVLIGWHAVLDLVPAHGQGSLAPLLGAGTLALALLIRWRWRRAPGLLIALVTATLASVALQRLGLPPLARVGTLPQAWPPFALPAMAWSDLPRLATIALALTLVSLGQSVAIAKAVAARSGQVLDVNRECVGQGLANMAGALFSGFASCGSINRSMPNLEAGARTPLAGALAALAVVLLVAVAGPLLAWVPMAAVSALLLMVALTLVDTAHWRELLRLDRREAAVAAGTLLAVLLLPLQDAVLMGVAASLVVYLYRSAHPALRSMGFAHPPQPAGPLSAADPALRRFVVLEPGAPECPQLKLLRMEGSVWFGAAAHVSDALRVLREGPAGEFGPPRHLLVMSKSMNFIDAAGAALWEDERRRRAEMDGGLYFHRPRPEVLATWQASGFIQRLGAGHLFADKRSAIAAIVPKLDGAVCARCHARVFEECARQPAPQAPAAAGQAAPARVEPAPGAGSLPAPAAPPAP